MLTPMLLYVSMVISFCLFVCTVTNDVAHVAKKKV